MPNGKSIVRQIEEKFGLPRISQVTEALDKFPDARQMKLIKETLEAADRISSKVPDLGLAIELIKAMNSVPLEQLHEWEKFLRRVEALLKKSPQELIDFLMSLKEK